MALKFQLPGFLCSKDENVYSHIHTATLVGFGILLGGIEKGLRTKYVNGIWSFPSTNDRSTGLVMVFCFRVLNGFILGGTITAIFQNVFCLHYGSIAFFFVLAILAFVSVMLILKGCKKLPTDAGNPTTTHETTAQTTDETTALTTDETTAEVADDLENQLIPIVPTEDPVIDPALGNSQFNANCWEGIKHLFKADKKKDGLNKTLLEKNKKDDLPPPPPPAVHETPAFDEQLNTGKEIHDKGHEASCSTKTPPPAFDEHTGKEIPGKGEASCSSKTVVPEITEDE